MTDKKTDSDTDNETIEQAFLKLQNFLSCTIDNGSVDHAIKVRASIALCYMRYSQYRNKILLKTIANIMEGREIK